MVEFSKHQLQIWKSMIKLIDDYLENRIEYAYLVKSLEGTLDAGEFQDHELIKRWYSFWTPLEIVNAEREIKISEEEKRTNIQKMKKFLLNSAYKREE